MKWVQVRPIECGWRYNLTSDDTTMATIYLTYDITISSIDSSTSFFELSRRSFLNGTFKEVLKDDKVLDRRVGGRLRCVSVVSDSSLLNLNPFSFCLTWSSSKVRVVRFGSSAWDGSWFLHDVHMDQKVRIKIIPHSIAMTERVAMPESCKHINPNAIRKDTMLLLRKIHIRNSFKHITPVDKNTHPHISNAYGKLNMIARVSRPSRGWVLFLKNSCWKRYYGVKTSQIRYQY